LARLAPTLLGLPDELPSGVHLMPDRLDGQRESDNPIPVPLECRYVGSPTLGRSLRFLSLGSGGVGAVSQDLRLAKQGLSTGQCRGGGSFLLAPKLQRRGCAEAEGSHGLERLKRGDVVGKPDRHVGRLT